MATTSDLRRALCTTICSTVYAADSETKAALAADLAVLPFESMGDEALIGMARRYLGAERVADIVAKNSAERFDVTDRFMCPTCLDQKVVGNVSDGFTRCPRCNPGRAPEVLVLHEVPQ